MLFVNQTTKNVTLGNAGARNGCQTSSGRDCEPNHKIRDFNQKRFFKKLRNWNKVITVLILLELESLKFIGFFTYFEDFIGFTKVESVFIAYSFF